MEPEPTQIILLLDVDADVDTQAVLAHVPPIRRARHELKLTLLGYERADSGTPRNGLDWSRLLEATHRMAREIQELRPGDGTPVEIYVAGFAPLSVFFALGIVLDTRTTKVTAINLRRNEAMWDVLPLLPVAGPTFFTTTTNVDPNSPSDASGRVGLYVSMRGSSLSSDAVRAAAECDGTDRLAGIVTIAAPGSALLDAGTIGPCMRELTDIFSAMPSAWPARSGLTVLLAGPAPLALVAGLCLNRNQYLGGTAAIDLTEYVAGSYQVVGRLPLPASFDPVVPEDAESLAARHRVFDAMKAGVLALKASLQPEHMRVPVGFGQRKEERDSIAETVLRKLREVSIDDEPRGQDFWLSTMKGRMSFGHGLLHALVGVDEPVLRTLGQLFALHEIMHDPQGITSNTYRGIGRAGVVLEDLDFWADAFAISVAFEERLAEAGEVTQEACRRVMLDLIDAHIEAMRAFDRMEQGDVLRILQERRLRRYLMWYLQRARAETVRSLDDVRQLLDKRVFVEIAPLKGRLDERNDKVVTSALSEAELFVTVGGYLVRVQSGPGFAPSSLVESVRTFNEQKVHEGMDRVVDQHRAVLAPWVDG